MKKLICALLVITMLSPCAALVSCRSDENSGRTTTTASTTASTTTQKPNDSSPDNKDENDDDTVANLDHLNGLDFGNKTINFAVASTENKDYHLRSIYVDEESIEVDRVNKAIYERNQKIEKMLNVKIAVSTVKGTVNDTAIETVLLGGSSEIDIVSASQCNDIEVALEGVIYDLNLLSETNSDYIKWNRRYWASDYIDALSFGNKRFWLAGDLSLDYTGSCNAVFVNKALYDKYYADLYGSIYDLVKRYDWTYDTFTETAAMYHGSTQGVGLALPVWYNTNAMAVSAGVTYTSINAKGKPVNNLTESNSSLLGFIEKYHNLINTDGVNSFDPPSLKDKQAMELFASGEALFAVGKLDHAAYYLRDMSDGYYVIPAPMLNKDQGAYYSAVEETLPIYGINISSEKIAAAAATLEAMAYESYFSVRPVFYQDLLNISGSETADPEALEMLDIIHDGIYTDLVYLWKCTEDLDGMLFFLSSTVSTEDYDPNLTNKENRWANGLKEILKKIEAVQ